jgi:hypothetical protein
MRDQGREKGTNEKRWEMRDKFCVKKHRIKQTPDSERTEI